MFELPKDEQFYKVIFDNAPAGVVISRIKDGKIIKVNKAGSGFFGFKPEEMIGKSVVDLNLLSRSEREEVIDKLKRGDFNKDDFEVEFKTKHGNKIYLSLNVRKIKFEDNYCILYMSKDITNQRNLITRLVEERDKARLSDKLKSSFLSNVSHEIRTPLNAINGFSNLLKKSTDGILSNDDSEYIDIILKSTDNLNNIIDSVINISMIESDNFNPIKKEIIIQDLIQEMVVIHKQSIDDKGKDIDINIEAGTHGPFMTYNYELVRVLNNIITNAIKFTDQGYINISYSYSDGKLNFEITDTGIGIDSDNKDLVFDKFTQIDHELSRSNGGVGLGLYLCKTILNKLNCDISFISERGRGTTFKFDFPVFEEKENKILIIEDDHSSAALLEIYVKSIGYVPMVAKKGLDALDVFKNEDICLVLLDIRLPDIDGHRLSGLLKEIKNVPIVAQTAYALCEDIHNIKNNDNIDKYMSKPIDKETLCEIIKELLC